MAVYQLPKENEAGPGQESQENRCEPLTYEGWREAPWKEDPAKFLRVAPSMPLAFADSTSADPNQSEALPE
jgi:hypothetical protein